MKYNPYTHIIGKVYDLTQENMNALLDEIDKLNLKLKELHSDSLEDHQEYKRATTQLIKDLRDENARYREALEYYANGDTMMVSYHEDRYSYYMANEMDISNVNGVWKNGMRARKALEDK